MKSLSLGPIARATVVCPDLESCIAAYAALNMRASTRAQLTSDLARAYGAPELSGAACADLCSESGLKWLRLIENSSQTAARPFGSRGWMALEVVVQDVDMLADDLADSAFEIIRGPANLGISSAIRAMQVAGPAGEVLYLTQITKSETLFSLPTARVAVDCLFVAVLNTAHLEQSIDFYNALGSAGAANERSGGHMQRFAARLTAFNQTHHLPLETEHEIAFIQIAGDAGIEIDAPCGGVVATRDKPATSAAKNALKNTASNVAQGLPTGCVMMSFEAPRGLLEQTRKAGLKAFYLSNDTAIFHGPDGELIEIIESR